MVLDQKVGRKRSFWHGLLLSIATVGIYSLYWNYKAHNELYRQFEMHREGRDEGVVWYILGLVLPPLLLAYAWTMIGNIRYVRQRMGLSPGLTAGRFILLVTLGVGVYLASGVYNYVANPDIVEGETPDVLEPRHMVGYGLALAGVAALFLVPYAYSRLQGEINEVWDAYEARLQDLRAVPARPLASVPAQIPPPTRRYYADLAPPAERAPATGQAPAAERPPDEPPVR